MTRMTIGDFARATRLTPKALRLYDELGLVRPAEVDESSGYRYYRDDQLAVARLVARLRLIGLPLQRIKSITGLAPAARATELSNYWRQTEADIHVRRVMVADLLQEICTEENPMHMIGTPDVAVASRMGTGARDAQQDALLAGFRLHAVADGFGSDHDLAATALAAMPGLDGTTGELDPVRLLDEAFAAAATAVAARSATTHGDSSSGCTLTALLLGDTAAAVAHVGDSRAYLVREGHLSRLTRDHTHVQSLVDEGRLTDDEARQHERRAQLNRALQTERSALPDISLHPSRPGDRFVLTTDGVHAVIGAAELSTILLAKQSPEEIVRRVEQAVLAAGAPDNYAVVAVELAA